MFCPIKLRVRDVDSLYGQLTGRPAIGVDGTQVAPQKRDSGDAAINKQKEEMNALQGYKVGHFFFFSIQQRSRPQKSGVLNFRGTKH